MKSVQLSSSCRFDFNLHISRRLVIPAWILQYIHLRREFTRLRTDTPQRMLYSEWQVKNAIHLAFAGAFPPMRVDRRFYRLSRCRIRDPHTSNSGRHLDHHAVV